MSAHVSRKEETGGRNKVVMVVVDIMDGLEGG